MYEESWWYQIRETGRPRENPVLSTVDIISPAHIFYVSY